MRRLTEVFSDFHDHAPLNSAGPASTAHVDPLGSQSSAAAQGSGAAGRGLGAGKPVAGSSRLPRRRLSDLWNARKSGHLPDNRREQRARAFELEQSWQRFRQSLKIGLPLMLMVVVFGSVSWGWYTGRLDHWGFRAQSSADASVAGLGLTLQKIQLQRDPEFTRLEDIRAAIGATEGSAILSTEPAIIRENLLSLPWVEDATVERRLPNIISVGLVERRPTAVWQSAGEFHLLDDAGDTILSGEAVRQFKELPRLVGQGADADAMELLKDLERFPALKQKVRAAIFVNTRRWDLVFDGGVRVMLPQKERNKALLRLANLDKSDSLLDREVIEVDLRLQDRMVVRKGTPASLDGEDGYDGNFGQSPSAEPASGQPT